MAESADRPADRPADRGPWTGSSPRSAWLMGALWAVGALVVLVAVFDSPSRAPHHSPDEAAAEHATRLVADHGRPVAPLPFDDPSGIGRPRVWARAGGTMVPAYPPATFYLFGLPATLPGGAALRFLLPAAGLGSLVAGVALLLPARRRWMAALLPGLAFPATYWLLRPWHNLSTVVALAGIGALCTALRVRTGRPRWLAGTVVAMMLAAAVRPDQVHVLLGLSLLAALATARDRRERWLWAGVHLAAAAAWLAVVLGTNRLTTGAWLTSPNDLLDFPTEIRPVGRALPFPLPQLLLILAPRGWPDWSNVGTQLGKYWFGLGPVAAVFLGAVAGLTVLWRRHARTHRAVLAAGTGALLLLTVFTITRVSATDWGIAASTGALHHTLPRYTSLVYVGVAIAAVAGAAALRQRWSVGGAGVILVVVALWGVQVAGFGGQDQESLDWLRGQLDAASRLEDATAAVVPDDAFLWLARGDKFLWDVAPVGLLEHERSTSPARVDVPRLTVGLVAAHVAGFDSWLLEVTSGEADALKDALRPHGLTLELAGFTPPPVPGFAHEPAWRVTTRETST